MASIAPPTRDPMPLAPMPRLSEPYAAAPNSAPGCGDAAASAAAAAAAAAADDEVDPALWGGPAELTVGSTASSVDGGSGDDAGSEWSGDLEPATAFLLHQVRRWLVCC